MKINLLSAIISVFFISSLASMEPSPTPSQNQISNLENTVEQGEKEKIKNSLILVFQTDSLKHRVVTMATIINWLEDLDQAYGNLSSKLILNLLHEIAQDPKNESIREDIQRFFLDHNASLRSIRYRNIKTTIENMYETSLALAESYNLRDDKVQSSWWQNRLNALDQATFKDFSVEVHDVNIDTNEAVHVEKFNYDNSKQAKTKYNALFTKVNFDKKYPNKNIISLVIYYPKNHIGKLPIGIFSHGGSENHFHIPTNSQPIMTALAGLGYAIVAPNWRSATYLTDMTSMIAYLKTLDYADTSKIVLTGISAGTNANAAIIHQIGFKLAGAFLHSGNYNDLTPLPPPDLPVFLAHGGADPEVPLESFKQYIQRIKKKSINMGYSFLQHGGHHLISPPKTNIQSFPNPQENLDKIDEIIKQSAKRYNSIELKDYMTRLVEFLDKIAYGESPFSKDAPETAQSYKKTPEGTWVKSEFQRGSANEIEDRKHKKREQIAASIITKAQTSQILKTPKNETIDSELLAGSSDETLKNAPYSQSEAQLKIVLGKQYQENQLELNIENFLKKYDEDSLNICQEYMKKYISDNSCMDSLKNKKETNDSLKKMILDIIQQEKNHKGIYVLYHGADSAVGFLYDVYSTLRRFLTIRPKLQNEEQLVTRLRMLDDAFFSYLSAKDLIDKMKKLEPLHKDTPFNYLPGYQDVGLSAQWFLFGSYPYWGNSSFFRYFCESATGQPVNIAQSLRSLFQAMGVDLVYPEKIIDLYISFYKNNVLEKDGRLLQIFISPKIIDKVTYVSETYGYSLDLQLREDNTDKTNLPSQIIPLAMNDTPKFEEILASNRDNFKYQIGPDRDEFSQNKPGLKYINSLESRFFMKPEYMDDPSKIQIISYHLIQPNRDYNEKLYQLIVQTLKEWLVTYNPASLDISMQQLPLTKLHTYTKKGEMGEERSLQSAIQNDTTSLIYAIQNKDIKRSLLLIHEGADIDNDILERGTPLTFATQNGLISVVKALIDKKKEKNPTLEELSAFFKPKDFSPLGSASALGYTDIVKLLLQEIPSELKDVNFSPHPYIVGIFSMAQNMTPVEVAIFGGHSDIVKLFLQERPIETKEMLRHSGPFLSNNMSPQYFDLLKLFLHEMSTDAKNTFLMPHKDKPPLVQALNSGHADFVKLILESIPPEFKDTFFEFLSKQNNNFNLAAEKGYLEGMKLIYQEIPQKFKAHFLLEDKDMYNRTPLGYSIIYKQSDVLQFIIQALPLECKEACYLGKPCYYILARELKEETLKNSSTDFLDLLIRLFPFDEIYKNVKENLPPSSKEALKDTLEQLNDVFAQTNPIAQSFQAKIILHLEETSRNYKQNSNLNVYFLLSQILALLNGNLDGLKQSIIEILPVIEKQLIPEGQGTNAHALAKNEIKSLQNMLLGILSSSKIKASDVDEILGPL